jgi:hypothetical protein
VNIAARVCGQARAGEVLVTDTVRSLTRTFLPVRFEPRGTPRLKGIAEPIALYRVVPAGAAMTRTVRWRIGPGPRLRVPAAVVAALGVVAVIAVAALTLRPSGAGAPASVAPSATAAPETALPSLASVAPATVSLAPISSASAMPAVASSSAAASPPASDAYPTPLEADLLSRMPDTVLRGTCGRANASDAAPKASASIRCDLGGIGGAGDGAAWVIYDRFASIDQMQLYVIGVQDRYRLAKGSCRQQPAAWQQWSFGGFQGKLLCFRDSDSHAGVLWSYESSNISARAGRTDAKADLLYAWWTETSALMIR